MVASSDSLWGRIDLRFEARLDYSGSTHQGLIPLYTRVSLAVVLSDNVKRTIHTLTHPFQWNTMRPGREKNLDVSDIHIPLTTHEISRIEELRNGKDLNLSLQVKLGFLGYPTAGGEPDHVSFFGEGKIEIPRSKWVERFLHVWGYDGLQVWEVRTGTVEPHSKLQREYERLRSAVKQLDHGHWVAAHKECREATDSLKRQAKDFGLDSAMDPLAVKRLFDYLSVALHLETAAQDDWEPDRADAIMAVTLTKSLLDRIAVTLDLK